MIPLPSYQIPVEIFIYFLENDKTLYSVRDIVDMMKEKFTIEMQSQRIREILKGFVKRDRMLEKPMSRNGTSKPIQYFGLNPNIPEVPENNIISQHKTTLEILKHMKPIEFMNGNKTKKEK